MNKVAALLFVALALSACSFSPVLTAAEAVAEQKVDKIIDAAIARLCKGPVDIAVRTFKAHPSIHAAALGECPDTFGWLATEVLAKNARDQETRDLVLETIREAMAPR